MKIGIIGAGNIGGNLTRRFSALGHEVAVKVLRGAAARDGGEIARRVDVPVQIQPAEIVLKKPRGHPRPVEGEQQTQRDCALPYSPCLGHEEDSNVERPGWVWPG